MTIEAPLWVFELSVSVLGAIWIVCVCLLMVLPFDDDEADQ